jgi:ABC-type phosphate transport system substrate-binding protein
MKSIINIKPLFLIFFSLALLFFAESYAIASDVVVVGNKNLSIDTISKDTLKKIFLGEQTTLKDGTKVKFAILKLDNTDDVFLKEYLYYTSTRFIRHWRSQVFSGKGEMPPTLRSDEDMLKFLNDNSGAIGFVTSGADISSVKPLTVQ